MTFSIVARDPATGDLGVAVASKFLAVGAVVPSARAGVGALATQALANTAYGPEGLELMSGGSTASEVLARLTSADEGREHRQAGAVDDAGQAATFTGNACLAWAGGRTAEGVAAQGNILTGADVVDALIETYLRGGLPFPELLLAALKAADRRGGDRRGRQSAALLIAREGGGYGGRDDRWLDLRVDDHPAPIDELARLLAISQLLNDRPLVEDLLPIDAPLANELQVLLRAAGYTPQSVAAGGGLADLLASAGIVRTGVAREPAATWDAGWEAALSEWMSVENLEERLTARGWLDPQVLEFLRGLSAG